MCGFAGVLQLDNQSADGEALHPMMAAIEHRGPDDTGHLVDGPVAIGHQRLSIVDLSAAGRQPLPNEDGTVHVVCNGEIYNHLELRAELEAQGHHFRSASDSEVLVHGYEAWGIDGLLPRLNGMFAFALWDSPRRRLVLARDRLGIKPLFIAQSKERICFASEIKALVAHPATDRGLDDAALHHYLAFYVVPQPHTLLRSVRALPPAHHVVVEAGEPSPPRRWWSVPLGEDPQDRDWTGEVRACFERSIERRRMADVPVGAFLSGGTDSSAVVALMAAHGPLHTFSIGFERDSADLDELPHARDVATRYSTNHHERIVRGEDVADALSGIAWHLDEPAGFALCNHFVAEMAREAGVPVALSGLGGDELFAGYTRHVEFARREQLFSIADRIPAGLRAQAIGRLLGQAGETGVRAASFLRQSRMPFASRNAGYKFIATDAERRALYTDDFAASLGGVRTEELVMPLLEEAECLPPVSRIVRTDLHTFLPNDLLRHMDSLTMSFAIEARVPILDHELVELAARIPAASKIRGGRAKAVLKDALADVLPPGALGRRKQGFNFPMHRWMRGPLKGIVQRALDPSVIRHRGIFRPEAVQGWVNAFYADDSNAAMGWWIPQTRVWSLVMLELWIRLYLDPSEPRRPNASVEEILAASPRWTFS